MAGRTKAQGPKYRLRLQAISNSHLHNQVEIDVLDGGDKRLLTHQADLRSIEKQRKAAKELAGRLNARALDRKLEQTSADDLLPLLEDAWNGFIGEHRRWQQQQANGSPEAAAEIACELLDVAPDEVSRPLCLVAGVAYAASWGKVRLLTRRSVDAGGKVVEHDPPLVTVQDRLVIVRGDGAAFADGGTVPGARPLSELGLTVRLPHAPAPGRGWSGAGVKRYQAGVRPNPAEVFDQVAAVVDQFIDFDRSLAAQKTMCELLACYVLATWLLDAFQVVGYLWPNGEKGCAKTTLLQVVTETAYLGQLILSGSSYATLRDLADYGATLAFDDAENVMDTQRTDPDKRTLLLAGNRRGATIAVKEQSGDKTWVTRHVQAFCPRLFSAIRLPDPVLGSRSIIVPLVRSGDPVRSKRNVMDPTFWPCPRSRLVDDLWALALANLPALPGHDRAAAERARLAGRDLEPWRGILAVAHWLQHEHGATGLFERMESLAMTYQRDRDDYEENDATRVMFRALLELTDGWASDVGRDVKPADIAAAMNRIARDEDLVEADKDFTTAKKVGWLMKRHRFERGARKVKTRPWKLNRKEVEAAAQSYGVQPEAPGQSDVAANGDEEDSSPF